MRRWFPSQSEHSVNLPHAGYRIGGNRHGRTPVRQASVEVDVLTVLIRPFSVIVGDHHISMAATGIDVDLRYREQGGGIDRQDI